MKKMWKRFVSLLLACTLLAGMLPLSASAAVSAPGEDSLSEWVKSKRSELTEEGYTPAGPFPLQGSDLYQYTFTKNQYDDEGNLTQDAVYIILPGIDAANTQIPDYEADSSLKKPWGESNASAVYIADGVTGIGNHAFDGMTTLETLEIEDPTSLKSVGDYAFNGCDKLVGPLDLSGVTEMGKYAFNGCERLGSGENNKGVTLSDELTTIPENAFNTCGLKNVNIPTSCTEIGNNAFANNSLSGELNLPSSLNTIGERAFYRYNSSSPTGGFSSITIPSSVTKIGADAFSGHKSLETVTLEHEDKKNLTIENGAFGTDTYTAHNYLDSITVGDITYEDVHMGTQFLTKNNVGELLNNGVNCYLGDLKPLKFDHTDLPTCLTPGYRYYEMILEGASTGNEPIVVETKIEIPAPDHSYVECEDLPATCTQPERTHEHCTNLDNGWVRSCEEEEKIRIKEGGKRALGHNYVVTDIENPTIGAGVGDTVITYTCQNWNSDPDQNLHDGENISHTYSWKIEDKPIAASTAHTLEELTLPSVQGVDNTYYASLEWKVDEEKLNAPLEFGTNSYNVKLVVNGAGLTFPECTGIGDQLLQVTVQVDKIKLDFSQVEFQNNIRYVAQNNGAFGVLNLPEDADITKTEYRKDNGEWTEDAPEENAVNVGEYQVRVTFTYTSSKYLLDTDSHDLLPPGGYTLEKVKDGTGTITGPYEIKQMTADDLRVSPIGNLTYDGEEHETVQIDGVPVGADVTVQWNDQEGNPQTETYKAEATSMSVAGITNAGTYDVTITVEHGTFEDGSATKYARGVIAKREISTPTANTLGSYTPEKVQIGVNDPTGEYVGIYTVDNNKQINAGTYEATATLLAPNNYKWSTSEGAAVNISYTIPRRVVQKPGVTSSTYTFTGQPIEVLYRTNQERLDGKYDDSGKLTAYWKGYDTEYVVYTATDVKKTDAGDYEVTVALNNKDANNYWWAGQDVKDYSFTWKINKQSINAPTVEAADATYTGLAYDAKNKIKISTHTETSEDVLVLGSNHKYYTSQSGGNAIGTPVNAGTYWVAIDFDFAEGEKESNYNIVGNNRTSFTINKAPLTLTAPTDGLTATYTGQAITVPAPEIGSYPEHGEQNATLTYTYKLKDSDDAANTAEGELKLTDVGTYTITVQVSDSCRNYTSESKTYEFKITAADQTVRLTQDGSPVENSATISKTLGNEPFTVTGKGYVGENETNAKIAYAVTQSNASDQSEEAVVKVDANSGQVTLLRAGTATITVTAAGSANYGEATATYTITVDKGTPQVAVLMPEGGEDYTYPYTGKKLTFDATVTGALDAVEPVKEEKVSFKFYRDNNDSKGEVISGDQPTKIGTYWVEAVYAGDDNYNPEISAPVKFTISPAALEVEATGHDAIYDGGEHDPVSSITVTGVGGKTFAEGDYTVSYIEKGSDGEAKPDVDNPNWNPGLKVKDVAHSGDYWIKVVINDNDSYDPYIGSVKVTINPKPLTVTKDVTPTKVYDGTTDATKNVKFTHIDTDIEGEKVTADLVSAVYNSPNANEDNFITITYQLTAGDNTTLANYSLDGKTVTGEKMSETVDKVGDTKVGITPASITVAINDQEKVYDGQSLSIENPVQNTHWSTNGKIYSQNGVTDNLGITLSIASDSDAKNAGAYAITGKAENKNYKVTFTGNWQGEEGDQNNNKAGTYTIDPRPINVQIGNAEGFYGDAPVLTGVTLTYESTVDNRGLAPDEENVPGIELGTGANKESPVAEYTIYAVNGDNRVELIKPVVIGNYNVTFTQNGTYTVKQRPITITIEDQESDYGCEIAKLAYSETLSEAYTGTNENVVFVGDDETDLKIALSTTAKKGSDAGTYPISGKVTNTDLAKNYAITWKGENPYQENAQQATYTVGKADLAVEFTNEEVTVSMGGTVNNPLKFINQSNSDEELGGQPQDVTVKYSSNDQGVATVNETTGEITLVGTGNATITAEVTSGGKNFNSGASDTYVIHVAQDGGLRTTVTPVAGLTYTGKMQDLVTYTTSPEGATVTFTVTAQESGDQYKIGEDGIPQALDAGTYTVSWRTTLEGYREETGSITVTVAKADPSEGFTPDFVRVAYEENKIYDSTEDTILQVEVGYASEAGNSITYLSDDTQVARVEDNNLETILLNSMGTAHISARFAETENFQEQTVFFTLTVGQATTMINYTAEDYKVTYDGQAHGSRITVTSPSEYTIKYSDNQGASYDLDESPAITDVGSRTIYFQIQADGYQSAIETQTVTVEPKPIKEEMIAGIAESYTYTGKEITFDDAISLHDEGVLLKQNTDYTVSYDQNTAVGIGSVTITGTGNYKESVTKNFEITPVDASDLTASLNRTFGYYRNSETNNATVTVMHGSHTVDSSEITLTVTRQDSTIESGDVVKEGLKLTFNKAGIYTIHVEVSGTHKGAFDLTYTLLPQDVASDDFQVATDPVGRVWTYDGENRAFGVTVTSGGTSLQKGVDFTLRYTYLPYVGSQEENEYDPESTEFTEAGIYTVIVKGTGNYTGHAELVALIQPRDLSDAGITAAFAQTELVYNGEAQEPGVTLTYNGTAITQLKDTEYYGNTNAGEAQALSAAREGCNNFTGARVDAFTIEKKSLKDSTITAKADPEEYYYTGYPVTPAVTVTDSDRNVDLSIGADYTVTSDAVGPGKVNATVTGTGNYTDMVTVEFTILPTGAEPVETLDLTVTPSEWTWNNGQTKAAISVTFNGKELNDADYELTVSKDGETPKTVTKAEAVELLSAPGKYTITATGVGAYNGSTDTETVTIQKIQPEVTVTATPNSLSGGGKVTLTLKGEKLPAFAEGQDLSSLLTASAKDEKNAPDLSELEWETDEQTGVMTAELTLPNTSETYTFTLTFTGNEYYEAATASEQVVVAQQIISGGGGGPVEDQPADPDDTGVSDWLNTKEHLAYLAGYPGGTFGPDQNMTRAEAAQMFYNLLLEKDVEITVEFVDVPEDAWYATPVNTLASLGILSGVGNGRFDPERSITRAEFTVIAMKFANTSGGGVNIFSDVNEDDWFYSAVVDSTQYGWINGYPDGTFRPEATISRAEVTVIVNHMLGRAADRPYVIAHEEELNTFGDVNRGHWGYFHIAEATNAHEYHTEDGTESWTGLS